MSITASDGINWRQLAKKELDAWSTAVWSSALFESNKVFSNRMNFDFTDFKMKRLGTKDYGFFYGTEGYCAMRYKCSHLEAQRRFKVFLITRRLTR